MIIKAFEINWFKKFWLIFEFGLNISSLCDLLSGLIKKKFNMLYSYEKSLCS